MSTLGMKYRSWYSYLRIVLSIHRNIFGFIPLHYFSLIQTQCLSPEQLHETGRTGKMRRWKRPIVAPPCLIEGMVCIYVLPTKLGDGGYWTMYPMWLTEWDLNTWFINYRRQCTKFTPKRRPLQERTLGLSEQGKSYCNAHLYWSE